VPKTFLLKGKIMITREQKEQIIKEVAEKIKESKAIIFTDYKGISVEEMTELRKDLRNKGIELKVMKQTLFALAVKKAGVDIDLSNMKNHPVAFAFGRDEVEPAKAVHEFNKKTEKLEMLGGALNGKTISLEELKSLALMPSREEMYAKVVGSLASPLRGLVTVVSGNLRGLVNVLSQYSEQRSK
jgi:large subunit ribosomal protein L10